MDITAHSITLISIIVGLGLTEMFSNLHRLIRNRARVRWDWLPLAWTATLLFLVLNYWWALYLGLDGSRQATTAAEFGLILAGPLLLFLATASVLPHFEGDGDWDMRRHYESQRKVLILTFALYQLTTFTTALLLGLLTWNYLAIVRAVIFVLLISMLFVKSRWWDWAVVLAIMTFLFVRLTMQVVR
jgi:hypothetical protein